ILVSIQYWLIEPSLLQVATVLGGIKGRLRRPLRGFALDPSCALPLIGASEGDGNARRWAARVQGTRLVDPHRFGWRDRPRRAVDETLGVLEVGSHHDLVPPLQDLRGAAQVDIRRGEHRD